MDTNRVEWARELDPNYIQRILNFGMYPRVFVFMVMLHILGYAYANYLTSVLSRLYFLRKAGSELTRCDSAALSAKADGKGQT